MTILLIEPDTVLAKAYCQALEREGIRVASVAGAQSAITFLDQRSVDLIVVELQISNHNGAEFIYELRSYPEWRSIPVVIHTFVAPESLQIDSTVLKQLGIKDYLYKPSTSLQKLTATIARHIPVTV